MELEVRGLRVSLDGHEILKNVNMAAGGGRFIGLIGPNGSGKTTLLKCVYRALQPNGGAVFIDGRELGEYTMRESAQKSAVVAQHGGGGFEFTVMEMVMMGRAPHKRAFERDGAEDVMIARVAIRDVGLEGFEERDFATLSGGERQLAALARALAQQTPCLILDEPTNHLDIRHQLKLMSIVKNSGRTAIAAMHDLNLAAMYCDELYAMAGGRIAARGTPREVLTPAFIKEVYGVDAEIINAPGLRVIFKETSAVR